MVGGFKFSSCGNLAQSFGGRMSIFWMNINDPFYYLHVVSIALIFKISLKLSQKVYCCFSLINRYTLFYEWGSHAFSTRLQFLTVCSLFWSNKIYTQSKRSCLKVKRVLTKKTGSTNPNVYVYCNRTILSAADTAQNLHTNEWQTR